MRADASWQSRVFFTPVNDGIETQRAYGLLRVRAGFEPRSRRWEVAVYVRNLGNQDYITGTANVPIPALDRPARRIRGSGARNSPCAVEELTEDLTRRKRQQIPLLVVARHNSGQTSGSPQDNLSSAT